MKTLIALLLMSTSALALDLSTIMKNPDGLAFKDNFATDIEGCKKVDELSCRPDLTLGRLIFNSLVVSGANDKEMPAQVKFKRGELARHLYKGGEVTLTAEEITIIKEAIGRLYSPLLVYDAYKLIDPASR